METVTTCNAVRILNASDVEVSARDERGAGNANHRYEVYSRANDEVLAVINFQNGPIKEKGVNGIQNEDLLEIVIDRLVGFQAGEFACNENGSALYSIRAGLTDLRNRTQDRVARNVEGESKK